MECFGFITTGSRRCWIAVFVFTVCCLNTQVDGQADNDTFVSLQLCKDTVLYGALSWDLHSLCCLEIYGSIEDCGFVCPCINGARDCNFTAQTCECRDGYKGEFCETSCRHNKRYGRSCTLRCNCGQDAFCDPVTGVCVCKKEGRCKRCKVGRWGRNCLYPCQCGQGHSCDDDTGECICRNSTLCNETTTSYSSCQCYNGGTCTQEGFCNCRDGWIGENCLDKCEEGFYGPNCEFRCECGTGGRCHAETGFCLCPNLARGYKCPDRCPEGKFGPRCKYTCFCPEGLNCNPVSGNCECPTPSCGQFITNSHTTSSTNPIKVQFPNMSSGGLPPVSNMPSMTGPPLDMVDDTPVINDGLLWVVVGIVGFLLIIVILLLAIIVFKRQRINDLDSRKPLERLDTNDYESVDELNIYRRDTNTTLPPSVELPPIPTLNHNGSLPPVPLVQTPGTPEEPMVPRRVKSLMAPSRKSHRKEQQQQSRNSFHANTPSMFSSLSTISTRSSETLTPLPKSIQSMGITNEILANESAYAATIKSSLSESRWSSMPSVPGELRGSRSRMSSREENKRDSLVVADCDEFADYADPFANENIAGVTRSNSSELRENLTNERKAMGLIQSNPLYNGHTSENRKLLTQRSSPTLGNPRLSQTPSFHHPKPPPKKAPHTGNTKLRISHSTVSSKPRHFNKSLQENKRFSSPVLMRRDADDEDDYADPSDSVPHPRSRAHSDMRRSLNGSNPTIPESGSSPTYFTLEKSLDSDDTPNSSRPQSVTYSAANDSDYDELEEELIESSSAARKNTWRETPGEQRIPPHRKTYGGKTNNEADPLYFVLERNRNAHSERVPTNNNKKKAFAARAKEDDGNYSHLERVSFDKDDIIVSDLQNDDYAMLRT